ncbi:xanthine dehydrogenase family protein molybdopterin-binding subunit [Acidihalobacter aeolianus]|uniref:xanthine dehydrogenase family protein molybdopterin-binding subunit n=1 Tax=Acidihalobacter aeolianus TaxID=2792603 RepID=UPI000ADCE287|nr:xanthine dehydrogenase family protein molybdopterin-binding subunit [Acidihalobacter aeolianus]
MSDTIGTSPIRVDADDKLAGRARYVDDIVYPDMLHAATLRTCHPGGTLGGICLDPDRDWSEFVIVTAADIPGANCVKAIAEDQPVLAAGEYRHAAEPVALIAHPDRARLAEALAHIEVIETPGPEPLFDVDEALVSSRRIVPDNVFTDYTLAKGDLAEGERQAAAVIEGTFRTGAQEHVYIEPQGMIGHLMPDGELRIEGSMQCPYYVLDALVHATGLPAERIRVVQTATGGGFGGKEEYPSMIACHVALLALKASGRPVKMIYDRGEDMRATPKRHPSRSRVRVGADADGRLCLIDFDFALDGGAYTTLSPVVLSRGVIHAPGPYRCEHVRVRGRAVASNHPPFGAFRGFGAPQSIFALEAALDRLAERLGLDPAELRRRNLLAPGDRSATGQLAGDDAVADAVLAQALAESDYAQRRAAHEAWNRAGHRTRRGIGLATFCHGSGFTGNGEVNLRSRAGLRVTADGLVELLSSSTEIGQGMATTFTQIAADALQLPIARVRVAPTDTQVVPNSGPTVASRTCMVVGRLIQDAARTMIERLSAEAGLPGQYDEAAFAAACARLHAAGGNTVEIAQYRAPTGVEWDDQHFRGAAYASYAWATYVADVEVDLDTLAVSVRDFVAVQEIGRAVHPVIAAGQIEGGVAQGIGLALLEDVVWNDAGVMANDRITNYILPTSADLPPIRVFFQETADAPGPGGAKGIGELPMDGPAPAVANAVRHALGVNIDAVPILPEHLLAKLTTDHKDVA